MEEKTRNSAVPPDMLEQEMLRLKVACVQMRSGVDIEENIKNASELIEKAAAEGATLIATPEMTNLVDIRPNEGIIKSKPENKSPALAAFSDLAKAKRVWLLIGSLAVIHEGTGRLANRSFLIAPSGMVIARYDKIHMFDVEIGDGQSYRESASYVAGKEAVLADTTIAKIGMSICYDVRFPELYRKLAKAGAEIITCPAAFTKVTGEAHWHVLLRARAIETGAFILAPAQTGKHEDGRETYGHSLIISPWGEIIAELSDDVPGIIYATIDLEDVIKARKRIPALQHDQSFQVRSLRV